MVSKVKGHFRKEKLDQYRKTRRQNTKVLVVGLSGQQRDRRYEEEAREETLEHDRQEPDLNEIIEDVSTPIYLSYTL